MGMTSLTIFTSNLIGNFALLSLTLGSAGLEVLVPNINMFLPGHRNGSVSWKLRLSLAPCTGCLCIPIGK